MTLINDEVKDCQHEQMKPTGRITYIQLSNIISRMSFQQQHADATFEDENEESFAVELVEAAVNGGLDGCLLDDAHPVLRIIR